MLEIASISTRPSLGPVFGCGLGLGALNVFFFTSALRELRLAVAYPAFAGASMTVIF